MTATRTTESKPLASSRSAVISTWANLLQRKCACGGTPGPTGKCEECRKKRLQRKARVPGPEFAEEPLVPAIVYEVLRSPGHPLDAKTRALLEPRFGHDFSQVRVHADEKSAESALAVDALAYTVGKDIVFAAGQYQPSDSRGLHLFAHELFHTVQQEAAIDRSPAAQIRIAPAHTASEQQAEAGATAAVSGQQIQPIAKVSSPQLARRGPMPAHHLSVLRPYAPRLALPAEPPHRVLPRQPGGRTRSRFGFRRAQTTASRRRCNVLIFATTRNGSEFSRNGRLRRSTGAVSPRTSLPCRARELTVGWADPPVGDRSESVIGDFTFLTRLSTR